MNTNRLFELYATYAWPVVRHVVGLSRRCRRCILSERHGPLDDGLCAECAAFGSPSAESPAPEVSAETRARFAATLRDLVRGGGYHALVLLSGGKDSAYLLHRLATEHPALNVLCLTVNNGFMSPSAVENARLAAARLKRDWLLSNAHVDRFAAALRQAFLGLNGRGSAGVVDFTDGSLLFEVGQRTAQELGIPVVLSGLSWVQVQRIVGQDDFELKRPGEPTQLFPLSVWRPDERDIRRTVLSEGLMHPGTDSPLVSNSTLILAMNVVDVLNRGYSSFEPELAQLVREGKADRKSWLHVFELLEFATRRGLLEKDARASLAQLGLTLADVVKEPA